MRWLQTQNRIEEMSKILTKVAKSNGKALPNSVEEALRANTQIKSNGLKSVKNILYSITIIKDTTDELGEKNQNMCYYYYLCNIIINYNTFVLLYQICLWPPHHLINNINS